MDELISRQKLPTKSKARELLRVKGQFWTPLWIAKPMLLYASTGKTMYDPSVGSGIFFNTQYKINKKISMNGMEHDSAIIPNEFKHRIKIGDFLSENIAMQSSIVCNPPYQRHQRLTTEYKKRVNSEYSKIIGTKIDARSGIHIYFLIKALKLLKPNGKLAFIVSSDICEGKSSKILWQWISSNYRIDYVIKFENKSSPFEADINPMIFMIQNKTPNDNFKEVICNRVGTNELELMMNGNQTFDNITVNDKPLKKSIKVGLSRNVKKVDGVKLSNFANVCVGVYTGSNEFFHMTHEQAKKRGLIKYTIPSINRVKNIPKTIVTRHDLKRLQKEGNPTLLLKIKKKDLDDPKVRKYVEFGKKQGLHKKSLIASRKNWYELPKRDPPDILFVYLGKRKSDSY